MACCDWIDLIDMLKGCSGEKFFLVFVSVLEVLHVYVCVACNSRGGDSVTSGAEVFHVF